MNDKSTANVTRFALVACGLTWACAWPTAWAWMQHQAPTPGAISLAGISAFGPLFAAALLAKRDGSLKQTFGRWAAAPSVILLAVLVPAGIRILAVLLSDPGGVGFVERLQVPSSSEKIAALIVFPLGEEFGWRGFAYPRLQRRFGAVRGSLLLGVLWGLWHLVYSITPDKAGFDPFVFFFGMVELPLYSVVLSWVFEKGQRSMWIALLFHATAHLLHIELAPQEQLGSHLIHLGLVALAAVLAARQLTKSAKPPPPSARS